MNKHMKELSTLKPDALQKKHDQLIDEISTIQKSIKLGNTQNYHAASTKRRELARVKYLISSEKNVTVSEVKQPVKEKK